MGCCSGTHAEYATNPETNWSSTSTPAVGKMVSAGTTASSSRTQRKWSVSSLDSTSSALTLDRVAAGHGGTSILKYVEHNATSVPEIPRCIMKVYNETEASFYKQLQEKQDSLLPFTAKFYGEVEARDMPADLEGGRYMRLANILHGFKSAPNIMDWKLGIRSFGEEEASKRKLRKDLYEKLLEFYPDQVTQEEREAQGCTKYRWMAISDANSTLSTLGFRVDGMETHFGRTTKKDLRSLRTMEDVVARIADVFLPVPLEGGEDCEEGPEPQEVSRKILQDLRRMQKAMRTSELVRTHEFVGCSLFFVADSRGPVAGVYLIDFAHTEPLPAGVAVDHRSPWKAGNHEDGLLLGVDNAIACWERVLASLENSQHEGGIVRV